MRVREPDAEEAALRLCAFHFPSLKDGLSGVKLMDRTSHNLPGVRACVALAGLCCAALASGAHATATPDAPRYVQALGTGMEAWPYPYPVRFLPLTIDGQDVRMAYMDVPPSGPPNGRTAVLLHGKNFGSDYWGDVIGQLAAQGYRVVAPDQIGFGKSSKPAIGYSFDLLGANTMALLDALGVAKVDLIGHSTGGMLAIRTALSYPKRVRSLVLEDPIGLEDYRQYYPPQGLDVWYRQQLDQTGDGYRAFVQRYFAHWRPAYEHAFVEPHARMLLGASIRAWPRPRPSPT
jgi:dienelactone hydrolase